MSSRNTEGFVLPYVLTVIAILAIVSTIAAERLSRSTQVLSRIQDQARTEQMMMTAEAEAVFSILTGKIVENGIDLNPNSPPQNEFGIALPGLNAQLNTGDEQVAPPDIWPALGDKRVSSVAGGQVIVELQDISGLVSLNTTNDEHIQRLLVNAGVARDKARTLTARLNDYIDFDNNRQFKGAERADYRLHNKPIPTNSPLRSYEELARILDWGDAMREIDLISLKNFTTLKPTVQIRKQFAKPDLIDIIKLEDGTPTIDNQGDLIGTLYANNTLPSDDSRLTFWVQTSTGEYDKRVLEITRDVNNAIKPFRRFWVYETTVLENDLDWDKSTENELKNVIYSTSVRP